MKHYIIKPEFIDMFGSIANAYTVITEDDIRTWSKDFSVSEDSILSMLIEDRTDPNGYHVLYRFSYDKKTDINAEHLNKLIAFESGDPVPFFESQQDFEKAVKDGFVTWDSYYITVWIDE